VNLSFSGDEGYSSWDKEETLWDGRIDGVANKEDELARTVM
jgi:hypothetical protein